MGHPSASRHRWVAAGQPARRSPAPSRSSSTSPTSPRGQRATRGISETGRRRRSRSVPQHQYSGLGIFTVVLTITAPPTGTPITRTNYVTAGCVVPNFPGTQTYTAQTTWTAANFTGNVTYQPAGANGNSGNSNNPPNPSQTILSQEGGNGGRLQFLPPVRTRNSPWVCGTSINLRY